MSAEECPFTPPVVHYSGRSGYGAQFLVKVPDAFASCVGMVLLEGYRTSRPDDRLYAQRYNIYVAKKIRQKFSGQYGSSHHRRYDHDGNYKISKKLAHCLNSVQASVPFVVLKVYKICRRINNFLGRAMMFWERRIKYFDHVKLRITRIIRISTGILHGDSFSAL